MILKFLKHNIYDNWKHKKKNLFGQNTNNFVVNIVHGNNLKLLVVNHL